MKQDAIIRRLEKAAQFQAGRLGYDFGDDSWDLTRHLIRTGVDRIAADDVQDSEAHLALAEAAVAVFVSRMVVEAERSGLPELRENTFGVAHSSLCPLWPIC